MASLDAARAHAQQQGIWEEPIQAGSHIVAELQKLNGLQVLSSDCVGQWYSALMRWLVQGLP